MTNSSGLKRGLNMSFLPPACVGGGTGRAWEESSIADALMSFSASMSHESKKLHLPASVMGKKEVMTCATDHEQ